MTKKILLTGGAGYIGSHTYAALKTAGYDAVILDNFSNAHESVIRRLETLTEAPVTVCRVDILDQAAVREVFASYQFEAVIHFAAQKSVAASIDHPVDYFETNISGLINLLKGMEEANVHRLVFSSSATIYGDAGLRPVTEDAPRSAVNPYGLTKLVGEQMLEHLMLIDQKWQFGILRYFNPVGADPSALIGEDPTDTPNNLMPYLAKVAIKELPYVNVFGDDYATPDGTGVRDYIHVSDLAEGHVQSLAHLLDDNGSHTVNLGTGQGQSVMQVIDAYAEASGQNIPYQIAPRRPGDVAEYTADPSRAEQILGFAAKRSLADMCKSSWAWVSQRRN